MRTNQGNAAPQLFVAADSNQILELAQRDR